MYFSSFKVRNLYNKIDGQDAPKLENFLLPPKPPLGKGKSVILGVEIIKDAHTSKKKKSLWLSILVMGLSMLVGKSKIINIMDYEDVTIKRMKVTFQESLNVRLIIDLII